MTPKMDRSLGFVWLPVTVALALGMLTGLHWGVTPVRAQTSPEEMKPELLPSLGGDAPSLVVNSDPPGAIVTLRGPYEWVGVTPWRLTRQLSGLYRIEASRPGYDTWKSEVVLGAPGGQELNITLGRKTTQKALMRSVLIPGWGQMYRGSKGKGIFLLSGTIIAGGLFIWADQAYQTEVDDFEAAQRRYEEADRLEDLDNLWSDVQSASRDAQNNWDWRQAALGGLVGIYAFNVFDVLFFSPTGQAETSGFSDLDATTPAGRGLSWTASAAPLGTCQAALRWNW